MTSSVVSSRLLLRSMARPARSFAPVMGNNRADLKDLEHLTLLKSLTSKLGATHN